MTLLAAISVITAVIAAALGYESWMGHYRSGFPRREQWVAPVLAVMMCVAGLLTAIVPGYPPGRFVLKWVGLAGVVAGVVGVAYHHWFGMVKASGGYRLALHHAMYGAPPLAPLALSWAGAVGFIVSRRLGGTAPILGLFAGDALLILSLLGLGGALAQTSLLHYRGAFNTPYMYLPFGAPLLALAGGVWYLVQPAGVSSVIFRAALVLTFLTGIAGLGLHLRGLDRQMAGLRVPLFNVLQGPPALAPAFISAVAATSLLAMRLE